MKAEEIRKHWNSNGAVRAALTAHSTNPLWIVAYYLAEIAAQLAEMNERKGEAAK